MTHLRGSSGRYAKEGSLAIRGQRLTLLGVLKRVITVDSWAMRLQPRRLGDVFLRSRLVREERGIALVMAMGIMLVLAIALTTVIFLTAAGARDSVRSNAGQKAYGLAQAGDRERALGAESELSGHDDLPGQQEPSPQL